MEHQAGEKTELIESKVNKVYVIVNKVEGRDHCCQTQFNIPQKYSNS
jgi:hypothetical protein